MMLGIEPRCIGKRHEYLFRGKLDKYDDVPRVGDKGSTCSYCKLYLVNMWPWPDFYQYIL